MAEIPFMRVWHKRIINEAPATDSKRWRRLLRMPAVDHVTHLGDEHVRMAMDGSKSRAKKKKKKEESLMRPKIIDQKYRLAFRVKVQATASCTHLINLTPCPLFGYFTLV